MQTRNSALERSAFAVASVLGNAPVASVLGNAPAVETLAVVVERPGRDIVRVV